MKRCSTALAILIAALTGPSLAQRAEPLPSGSLPPWLARGKSGMVASDSPHASQVGLEILRAGGNAIDAAVAVSFALGVTRPYSTGLGGGGFMIARFADGRVVCQDFRETAPAAATADTYAVAASTRARPSKPSQTGYLAVAVPGVLAGRCEALTRYGTMPLARTVAPAIRLAQDGFPVDQHYVDQTAAVLEHYKKDPSLTESCTYVYQTHLRRGRLRTIGEPLLQPELARLLQEIAKNGPEFFYKGPLARAVAKRMRSHGGLVSEKDLADYRVRERKPVRSTYRGYELLAMPPPSSGGVALAEALNILETIDLPSLWRGDRGLAAHYHVEALKHVFADRARWLGDGDFARVPVNMLISKRYARLLAGTLDADECHTFDTYGSTSVPDDAGTSHFCVVDREGNVVVSTETINTAFGSLAAVDEWGLILNYEMDDFTAEPGRPNTFGLTQSARNAIAPGKRPLSSMSPTIVLKDGKPYLLVGASGGPRIISSVLNVLLCVTDYGMSLEQAILQPRPHHQWQPDRVYFDTDPPPAVKQGLLSRGHRVSQQRKTGIVQAILRTKDGWLGASDPRKGGRPAGY